MGLLIQHLTLSHFYLTSQHFHSGLFSGLTFADQLDDVPLQLELLSRRSHPIEDCAQRTKGDYCQHCVETSQSHPGPKQCDDFLFHYNWVRQLRSLCGVGSQTSLTGLDRSAVTSLLNLTELGIHLQALLHIQRSRSICGFGPRHLLTGLDRTDLVFLVSFFIQFHNGYTAVATFLDNTDRLGVVLQQSLKSTTYCPVNQLLTLEAEGYTLCALTNGTVHLPFLHPPSRFAHPEQVELSTNAQKQKNT